MRRKFKSEADEADVDMTPMLDIVFIMLIFFIVTTSFTKEKGIEINRPSANQSSVPEDKAPENVLITIDMSNRILVGTGDNIRSINARQIRANIERTKAANPNTKVIVKAHDLSEVEILMDVMNAAKGAGIPKDSISVSNYSSKK
jgi:biopolymer transport protein ExbD